jgi:hypothetical protein
MNWAALFEDAGWTVRWRITMGRAVAGDLVTTSNQKGYLRVMVGGKKYMVHRVLYEMRHGPIPEGYQVDHIDLQRQNNNDANLRLLIPADNAKHKGLYKGKCNKGIYPNGRGWYAAFRYNSVLHRSPTYTTEQEAATWYATNFPRRHLL